MKSELFYSNDTRVAATCKDGYTSNGLSSIVDVECSAGMWTPIDGSLVKSLLKCVPVCNFPCKNGGSCVAPNTCQCPPEFAGQDCDSLQPEGGCLAHPPNVPSSNLKYS